MTTTTNNTELKMQIIDYTEGMEIPKNCIVRGMPNAVYHSTEHISKSQLDLFDRSPAHLACAGPIEPTRAMEIGTAIHTAILEPERFKEEYILLTDAKDRRSALYRDASKVHGTERVLVSTECEKVEGMRITAHAYHEYTDNYLNKPHEIELSYFGICSETGVPIKCRFDLITECGHALDLKKTQDVRLDALGRAILNYRYHVQWAFYSHVYECVTGEPLKSFNFFFTEENAPHSCQIARLCEETKQLGTAETLENLEAYASNPNATDGTWRAPEVISLPVWYLNQNATEEIIYE